MLVIVLMVVVTVTFMIVILVVRVICIVACKTYTYALPWTSQDMSIITWNMFKSRHVSKHARSLQTHLPIENLPQS